MEINMEKILLQDEKYAGLYVALKSADDNTVVGAAKDPVDALKEAEKNGNCSPILFYVPKRNSVYIH
jgi:hypothetical protein